MTRLLVILGFAIALTACASSNVRSAKRDCEHCPEMVVIPAGTAIVGASANDRYSNPDERPERRVAIREPFAVSRYESHAINTKRSCTRRTGQSAATVSPIA